MMDKVFKILVVNPGSTSTKYAYYENDREIFRESISHSVEELSQFETIQDQLGYRKKMIESSCREHGIDLDQIDAFCGRGGGMVPSPSGTYRINEKQVHDCEVAACGVHHPAQLAAQICFQFRQEHGGDAFTTSGPDTDEYQDLARVTGLKDVFRESRSHALNQKEVALRYCKARSMVYEESNLVIAHLGGGISITAHRKGKMVDSTDILTGEGPMTPTRAGTMQAVKIVNMAFSGKYTKDELIERLTKRGGFIDHLGTDDAKEVEKMMNDGDEYAKLIFDALAYQISKFIGQNAVVLEGKVDGIILTGGIAHREYITSSIERQVGWIAPVTVMPGEFELEALAAGGLRVLRGEEEPLDYTGIPTFTGFDYLKRK
ncbi:MAG: butyrate kinase [Coriobacteriales bacterium]|jgi:butyrate kinase